jgi:NAD(P)-dependent dehydrogenase (short-subunit alcohol dehydrogenase family)
MTSTPTSTLAGKVALVTGASRGVGKGIAIGLGEAGAEVWVVARTLSAPAGASGGQASAPPGSLDQTVQEVETAGGRAVAVACDVLDDAGIERLFARLASARPRLDVLVNSAWGGYEEMVEGGEFTWPRPFWEQSMQRWRSMFDVGVRAAFACSRLAARRMVAQGSGLIVNVSYWAARKYLGNAIYGAAKCATDRLTRDMARDLASTGVAAVALYPGLVRTEKVLESAAFLDLSNSESPQFAGRAVAHLAADPRVCERSGSVVVAAELGLEYGFTDVDGRQPLPLTVETA